MERHLTRLRYGIHEFCYTLMTFPRAWRFMRNHRLWVGLRQYGWVSRALAWIGLLVGIFMIAEVMDWWDEHADAPLSAMAIGSDSLLWQLLSDGYDSLSDGVLNWVIIVLLEVVVYHFMRQTLLVILGKDVEEAHKFKPFLRAQVRMIKLSLIAVVLQEVLLKVGDQLLPNMVNWLFALGVQSLLLGYAIADNYCEQFELSTRQSWRHMWRHHISICLGLGLPLFLMLKVPLLGAAIGPLVTSVAAAIVLREKSDLHLIGYQMSAKEAAKAEKKAHKKAAKAERKARKKAKYA